MDFPRPRKRRVRVLDVGYHQRDEKEHHNDVVHIMAEVPRRSPWPLNVLLVGLRRD